jgi:transcriptional regulator with XRE-family HTH domain
MRRMKREMAVSAPLGKCIRLQRETRHLTQEELGKLVLANVSTMSRVETGNRDLLVTEFVALARAIGMPASVLLRAAERKLGPASP